MQVVLTNPGAVAVLIPEMYITVAAGKSTTAMGYPASALSGMKGLQKLLTAGTITGVFTPTADELGSGLLSAAQSVQASDIAPVAAADKLSANMMLRVAFAAGNPAEVVIYPTAGLPADLSPKFRVVLAMLQITTAAVGTAALNSVAAAGAGNVVLASWASTNTAGVNLSTQITATQVETAGATKGLFLTRSVNTVVGELILFIRRES